MYGFIAVVVGAAHAPSSLSGHSANATTMAAVSYYRGVCEKIVLLLLPQRTSEPANRRAFVLARGEEER